MCQFCASFLNRKREETWRLRTGYRPGEDVGLEMPFNAPPSRECRVEARR